MKKMLFAFMILISNIVHAQDMNSSMILSNTTVILASASEDDDPKEHADFYINNHRVVQNTSIDVRNINTTLLKAKAIKEDFKDETLTVKYSLNQLSEKTYNMLSKDSLKNFTEPTGYVTVDNIVYKNKQATVFVSILDKPHHEQFIKNHEGALKIVFGIAIFFGILMCLFMLSL